MTPDINNQQSAVMIESGCFVSEGVVKKTTKGAWRDQLVKTQKSAVGKELTSFIAEEVVVKTTKKTWRHKSIGLWTKMRKVMINYKNRIRLRIMLSLSQ